MKPSADSSNLLIDFRHDGIYAGVAAGENPPQGIVLPVQTHTSNVGVIEQGDGAIPPFRETDALVSFRENLAIGVRTADCVPIVLYAPDIRAVAAVHAGWKGSLAGIVDNVADILASRGADLALTHAAMGPCICGGCYEVSLELAARFADAGFAGCISHGRYLDLPAVNRSRLTAMGVPPENIAMPLACTRTDSRLPSWRRCPGTAERLVTWICLRPQNR